MRAKRQRLNTFTAIFQKVRGGYTTWVEEMPNVISEGKTRAEAEENLKDALELMLETNRIMSLKDPLKKMSKTGDEGIALSDSATDIKKKIMSATTDSGKEVLYDEQKKPGISNLMEIYALLGPNIKNLKQIETMYEGRSYADFKTDLGEVVVDFLKPFQEKYNELKKNPDYVMSVLTKSEEKARELATATLTEVKKKIGLE